MIFPSEVLFSSSTEFSDTRLRNEGLWLDDLVSGGRGEGSEEAEVLAGALRRPSGSLRLLLDMSMTEPE